MELISSNLSVSQSHKTSYILITFPYCKMHFLPRQHTDNSLSTANTAVWNCIHYHYINYKDTYHTVAACWQIILTWQKWGRADDELNHLKLWICMHTYIHKLWFIVLDMDASAYCIIKRQAFKKGLTLLDLCMEAHVCQKKEKETLVKRSQVVMVIVNWNEVNQNYDIRSKTFGLLSQSNKKSDLDLQYYDTINKKRQWKW